MKVDVEKCTGCGFCLRDCPLEAVRLVKKKAVIEDHCTQCGACLKVCEFDALARDSVTAPGGVVCDACPIFCQVKEGHMGACHRFENKAGKLIRMTPLHAFQDVAGKVGEDPSTAIRKPLITAIGSGTTYPDCKPAPAIVGGRQQDVDVVTVVTEAPLSYSSILVKIDTDVQVGEEGADVLWGKRKVGMVTTEQYGSKMLSIGGVNLLTGKDGFAAVRIITDIANGKQVRLKIQDGGKLELQVGHAPIINGKSPLNMRVGCGSATLGLFAPLLKAAADEVIILDSHITSLMSEHAAGRFVGAQPSGVKLRFPMSTPGRYFGDHGKGWGGTSIEDPLKIIEGIDENTAYPGLRLLITETTGTNGRLFELNQESAFREIPLNEPCKAALSAISSSCEPSRVSAVYMGGAGGSARAGVTRFPIKLTKAIHSAKASLTVGGAPTYVLPGGGINFMVDVERVKQGAFYWTPTPATICPIEYTMTLSDYGEMGGHVEAMKPFRVGDFPRMPD